MAGQLTASRGLKCKNYLFVLVLTVTGRSSSPPESDLVWAINVGGHAYADVDGMYYEAEESVSGGETGFIDNIFGIHVCLIATAAIRTSLCGGNRGACR